MKKEPDLEDAWRPKSLETFPNGLPRLVYYYVFHNNQEMIVWSDRRITLDIKKGCSVFVEEPVRTVPYDEYSPLKMEGNSYYENTYEEAFASARDSQREFETNYQEFVPIYVRD